MSKAKKKRICNICNVKQILHVVGIYESANIMPHVRLFCTVKRIYFLFYSRENLIISSHETTKQDYKRDIRTREHMDRRNSLRKVSEGKIKPEYMRIT